MLKKIQRLDLSEGYVKFNYTWIKSKPLPIKLIKEMNLVRQKLYNLKLIGSYPNGIGYGNISIRHKKGFIISGTETGNINKLSPKHYAFVKKWIFYKNHLTCSGPVVASSESLTHAAIYESDNTANAVIHIHNLKLWQCLLKKKYPKTNKKAPYGTVALVNEIKRLFKQTKVAEKKIIAIEGHREGIIAFGNNLNEAYNGLWHIIKKN